MSTSETDPTADDAAKTFADTSDGVMSGGDGYSGQSVADRPHEYHNPTDLGHALNCLECYNRRPDIGVRPHLLMASQLEFGSGMPRMSQGQKDAMVERGDVPDGRDD